MAATFERVLKALARRVRSRRRELKLTQEAVAEHAELSTRHYQKIEAGELNITLKTTIALANALNMEVRELF